MSSSASERVLVILPTFNEAQNIESVVYRIRHSVPSASVLIVDDNSPDGTGKIAARLQQEDSQVHALSRFSAPSLGSACVTGLQWGIDHNFDILIQLDANGSHAPEVLSEFLAAHQAGADIVKGVRWAKRSSFKDLVRSAEVLPRLAAWWTRKLLNLPTLDPASGLTSYRADALAQLALSTVATRPYCYEVDLLRRATTRNLRIADLPIDCGDRDFGQSKMSTSMLVRSLLTVTRWGITRRVEQ